MYYLLDTSFLVQFGRGRREETEWLQTRLNSVDTIGCCPITIAEVHAGAHPRERPGWAEIFGAMVFWPILPEDAALSGAWRYDMARRGIHLQLGDTLIAAVARRVGATVVTHNVKDFEPLGVKVEAL